MFERSRFPLKFVFRREITIYGKWPETGPGRKLGHVLYLGYKVMLLCDFLYFQTIFFFPNLNDSPSKRTLELIAEQNFVTESGNFIFEKVKKVSSLSV